MICVSCGSKVADGVYCSVCGTRQEAIRLGEVYESWKKLHYRKIGYKCRAGYENAWKTLSVLKDRPIQSLTPEDYQEAMDSLSGRSKSLQSKLRILIGQLEGYAARRGHPCGGCAKELYLDGKRPKDREIFSDEEISRLFRYAQSGGKYDRDAWIVLILIFTGFRPEELFEVKKSETDLEYNYIFAAGSKTEAGHNRVIPILPLVRPYILTLSQLHRESPYLITTVTGCRINLSNWRSRRFFPLMRELGINPVDDPHRMVPYCCRHTYASLADRAGVEKEILIKMIGHASYQTTRRFYIHERLDRFQREADKINGLVQRVVVEAEGEESRPSLPQDIPA